MDKNSRNFLTLRQLIQKISRYTLRNQDTLRKGVDHTMGGKVIRLYADRLEERGEACGIEQGTLDAIRAMVKNSGLKAQKVMDMMGLDAATQKRYAAML